jgi:hypothetical protein
MKRAVIEWPRSSDHGSRENTDRTDGCEDGRRISPTGLSRRPTSGADFHRKSAIGRSQSLLRDAKVGDPDLRVVSPAHPLRVFVVHQSGEYAEDGKHTVSGHPGHCKTTTQQALHRSVHSRLAESGPRHATSARTRVECAPLSKLTASRMNPLTNRCIGRQLAELDLPRSNSSNRCGLDHRDNASTNGLAQRRPRGHDYGQLHVFR